MKINKITLILFLLPLFSSTLFSKSISDVVEINNNWEYTHFSYCHSDDEALEKSKESSWRKAQVPGDIHLDLQNDGILPDLYFGQNFYSSIWVEDEDFLVRNYFDAPVFYEGNAVYLDFEGLDTYATIWLNGVIIGKTHNMFMTYNFEITNYLKEKNNELIVRLASPMKETNARFPNLKEKTKGLGVAFNVRQRLLTRKMQMSYGWDNVPRIITTGIYRPVKLRVAKVATFENVWFRSSLSEDHKKAHISVDVSLIPNSRFNGELEVVLTKDQSSYKGTKKIKLQANRAYKTAVSFEVENPDLWWPAGYGEQHLYMLEVKLKSNKEILDTYTERVGIREFKVVTTPVEKRIVNYRIGNPDKNNPAVMDGGFVGSWSKVPLEQPEEVEVTPMKFYVNGRYVFMKGYNWQPLDVFEKNVTPEHYRRSVIAVKETNSNMIRVWGGGNVENPTFYDACDEEGILVWQDFFYASAQYPNDDEFLAEIEKETINIVKRLRNRASIVAWCGDNETDMFNHDSGRGQFANKITHEVQKRILATYDPDRYWHPSSPSGGGYPRSPWGGDKRNWGAGFPEDDYAYIRGDEGTFISEGGVGSIPQLSTIRKYIPEMFAWPINSDHYFMRWGDVPTMRRNFPKTVYENITRFFGKPDNLSEMIYLSQVFQANGYTRMAHHFRTNMNSCGGVLIWKWADAWPSVSMSVIDHDEFKKASWYTVRRAFAPAIVTIRHNQNQLSVCYVNDLHELSGQRVICQLKTTDGELVKEWSKTLTFKENTSESIIDLDIEYDAINRGHFYVKVWVDNNETIYPYYYIPSTFKDLKVEQNSQVQVQVNRLNSSTVELLLTASAFTPYFLLTATNPYITISDNAFFIEKNEPKKITLSVPEGELWGDLYYRWWESEEHNIVIPSTLIKTWKMPNFEIK
jgi:beta-mannosidase